VLLYALRYEKSSSNSTEKLVDLLRKNRVDERKISCIQAVIKYAVSEERQEDLFSPENVLARTKNVFKGLKGVENVYTQHIPQLVKILEGLARGKLKEEKYPFCGDERGGGRVQDVVIFMIGGVTYAEGREVENFNRLNGGVRVVLGGTRIHNSSRYVCAGY
jgi:vacuolar protein sorting-associated protein 45